MPLQLLLSKAVVGFEQSIIDKGETFGFVAFAGFSGINVPSKADMIFLDVELKGNVQQQTVVVYLHLITTKDRCKGPKNNEHIKWNIITRQWDFYSSPLCFIVTYLL